MSRKQKQKPVLGPEIWCAVTPERVSALFQQADSSVQELRIPRSWRRVILDMMQSVVEEGDDDRFILHGVEAIYDDEIDSPVTVFKSNEANWQWTGGSNTPTTSSWTITNSSIATNTAAYTTSATITFGSMYSSSGGITTGRPKSKN